MCWTCKYILYFRENKKTGQNYTENQTCSPVPSILRCGCRYRCSLLLRKTVNHQKFLRNDYSTEKNVTFAAMKYVRIFFVILSVLIFSFLCSCHRNKTDLVQTSKMTAEMAYEGVSNYCHSEYDWSIAADNPSMMSVTMGEETESEYQVIFRSYTGSFVIFYVEKASGKTRIVESVPALDVDSVVGTINLLDYVEKNR